MGNETVVFSWKSTEPPSSASAPVHGEEYFYGVGTNSPRCSQCVLEQKKHRKRIEKKKLVDMLGGKCQRCGYDKCLTALEFHHRTGELKMFSVSSGAYSFKARVKELEKCDLLCANCHREIHAGNEPEAPILRSRGRPTKESYEKSRADLARTVAETQARSEKAELKSPLDSILENAIGKDRAEAISRAADEYSRNNPPRLDP